MRIAVPKEILNNENRVALTPAWAKTFVEAGHEVFVESNAGIGSSFTNQEYINSGAKVIETAEEIFNLGEIIVKVKQPLKSEISLIRENQILFTYLHLAADKDLVSGLKETGAHCIAYETIEDKQGRLPLLRPMSEIAGRLAVQLGARFLERGVDAENQGRGILLGGSSGVPQGKVTILGAGVAGSAALKIALGLGAHVNILDTNMNALTRIDDLYGSRVTTIYSFSGAVEDSVLDSDLVIGSILIPGKKAPKIVTEEMVKKMRKGSVVIDISVDQGGCIESSELTSHDKPVVNKHGVLHYGVPNMPGVVPNTSTHSLCNSTMPYLLRLSNNGLAALDNDEGFKKGLNISNGQLLIEF